LFSFDGCNEQLGEFGLSWPCIRSHKGSARSNQQVIARQPVLLMSEGLSYHPLQEIPGHRLLDRTLAYNNAQSCKGPLILHGMHDEPVAPCNRPGTQERPERRGSSQPYTRSK